jgi:hypothetical protein
MFRSHVASFAAAMLAATLCGAVLAAPPAPPAQPKARDAALTMPKTAPNTVADKSGRCETKAVNECRSSCDGRRYDTVDKNLLPKLQYECKQDCIRGC